MGEFYKDEGLVVCSSIGGPVPHRNLNRAWDTARKKIDVPKITFHEMRHTHATLLLKNGVHPKVVSERLGHSSVQVTIDRYSHVLPGLQEAATEKSGKRYLIRTIFRILILDNETIRIRRFANSFANDPHL